MTVQVSSADHELLEGYFTLGDSATVVAKPGSDLYKFLARQRGRKVKVVLSEAAGRSCHGSIADVRQNASSCLMTCPTMLLGVEAPAVRPTLSGPPATSPSSLPPVPPSSRVPDRPVPHFAARHQAFRVGDVKRAHPLRTDSGQIAGIAAVVAAHHQHQIQRLLVEQRDDRVLPFLGCAADGVEGPEMAGQGFLP